MFVHVGGKVIEGYNRIRWVDKFRVLETLKFEIKEDEGNVKFLVSCY